MRCRNCARLMLARMHRELGRWRATYSCAFCESSEYQETTSGIRLLTPLKVEVPILDERYNFITASVNGVVLKPAVKRQERGPVASELIEWRNRLLLGSEMSESLLKAAQVGFAVHKIKLFGRN